MATNDRKGPSQVAAHAQELHPHPPRIEPPTLVDALIIIFVSAALVLFIFWLGTTVGSVPVLETLPAWVTGAFQSVWSSVVSGAVGIGLAIVRALMLRAAPRPHYLLWILITTVALTAIVFALAFFFRSDPVTRLTLPDDLKTLPALETAQATSPQAKQRLLIQNYPGMGIGFRMEGEYSVNGRRIEGKLINVAAWHTTGRGDTQPVRLTRVVIAVCYLQRSGSREEYNLTPANPGNRNSVEVDTVVTAGGGSFNLPALEFRVDVPATVGSQKMWLCAQIWNAGGGNYPGYQTDRFLDQGPNDPRQKTPLVDVVWQERNPLRGAPTPLQCPCALVSMYPQGGFVPGAESFTEVKNNCPFAIEVLVVRVMRPVELEKLFKEGPFSKFALTKIPPGHRARADTTGSVQGVSTISKCG